MSHYILRGREVIEESNLMSWANWFGSAIRTVGKTSITLDIHVSTVFLGLDHQFEDGPPLVFETMIFGGDRDQECWRYSTYEQAEKGHAAIVAEFT